MCPRTRSRLVDHTLGESGPVTVRQPARPDRQGGTRGRQSRIDEALPGFSLPGLPRPDMVTASSGSRPDPDWRQSERRATSQLRQREFNPQRATVRLSSPDPATGPVRCGRPPVDRQFRTDAPGSLADQQRSIKQPDFDKRLVTQTPQKAINFLFRLLAEQHREIRERWGLDGSIQPRAHPPGAEYASRSEVWKAAGFTLVRDDLFSPGLIPVGAPPRTSPSKEHSINWPRSRTWNCSRARSSNDAPSSQLPDARSECAARPVHW